MLPGQLAGPSTPLRSHILRCKVFQSSIRRFSRTCSRKEDDHYQTLGVPHTASKSQIKAQFYRLSKVHHPDVSHNPESKALFTKASAAYTVLINDRDRRAYDRSLLHRAPPQSASTPFNARAPPTRQARAGYAWETRPRGAGRRPAADLGYAPKPGKSPYTSSKATPGYGRHYDPTTPSRSPLSGAQRRMEENDRQLDKIRNESMVLRAVQLDFCHHSLSSPENTNAATLAARLKAQWAPLIVQSRNNLSGTELSPMFDPARCCQRNDVDRSAVAGTVPAKTNVQYPEHKL